MENNGKCKTARADRKSKKPIIVTSKSQTECEKDWTNCLLIKHCFHIELFIVSNT